MFLACPLWEEIRESTSIGEDEDGPAVIDIDLALFLDVIESSPEKKRLEYGQFSACCHITMGCTEVDMSC